MASESAVTAPASPPPDIGPPVALPPPGANAPTALPQPKSGDDRKAPVAPAVDDPHIALLLPLDSKVFVRHATAVRNGFLAAAKVHGGAALPVRAYSVGDETDAVVETYIKALASGARLVVGPLTRNGVTAIVESAAVLVPTLLLNVPESRVAPPPGVYILSLNVEADARQVAQRAWQDGYRKAITINGDTSLLKRIHQAFVDEFIRLGGAHVAAYGYTPDPEGLTRIKRAVGTGTMDMGFLALDFTRARLARPYLGSLPVYATSQAYPADAGPLAGFDLAGVRFLDMPWLLQPDHPAVMVYPRSPQNDIELERFYALGIDAYRVALTLLAGNADSALDGVTGRLTLGADRQFTRGLTTAQFSEGKLTVVRERQ